MHNDQNRFAMDESQDDEDASKSVQKNGRNGKLKVLVRSHAMREEQSPPRVPTPVNVNHGTSARIQIDASPVSSSSPRPTSAGLPVSNPIVVLSPSISRNGSPTSIIEQSSPEASCSPSEKGSRSPRRRDNSLSDRPNDRQRNNRNSSQTNVKNRFNGEVGGTNGGNMLIVGITNGKGKLRQQSSSQGSFESGYAPSLSRESSSEQYTDSTGADLEAFIPEMLNRNPKDRILMLRIEQELVSLAKDKFRTHFKFPAMSSYQRMLVHRCAAYFGMEHNIESSGKCVVVNKSRNTRIPEVPFKEHLKDHMTYGEEPRRSILKRDSNSVEDYGYNSADRRYDLESRRSKSFEEREVEYEKVRKRIFKGQRKDSISVDDIWSNVAPWSSSDSETISKYRLHLPDYQSRKINKLLKVQSEEIEDTARPHVSKSYSFGGYGNVLNRGDSMMSTHSAGPRLLTKQDSSASSVSWHLSPSSSGYKSQSQISESVTPSPTSTPLLLGREQKRTDLPSGAESPSEKSVVWAVTDIESVPKGSLIIDPQSGRPIKNADGSLYHYDPNNLPSALAPPERSHKPSPVHSPKKKPLAIRRVNTTNSSTSPMLPYTHSIEPKQGYQPPIQSENAAYPPHCPPLYNHTFGAAQPSTAAIEQVYPQQCLLYNASYGVPMQNHFEGRIPLETSQLPEVPTNYYMNVQENLPTPLNGQVIYQQPASFWTQSSLNYYPNQTHNQARFPITQPTYSPPSSSFIPQSTQTIPNNEIVPVYPNQQLSCMFPTPTQPNPTMVFPNSPSIIYAQNPASVYQHYPQTPSAAAPTCTFPAPIADLSTVNLQNLTQNMAQMNIAGPPYVTAPQTPGYLGNKPMTPYRTNVTKGFMMGSSHNSTGTNSPATTVIATFGPNPGMFRTPPGTPPTPSAFVPNMNMVFRPVANIRASTPVTSWTSRSPTPANDVSHFNNHRMSVPTPIYHGVPYVFQHDGKSIVGRGQPNVYRQPTPPRQPPFSQNLDNTRSQNGRKYKSNRGAGLPPSGK